MRKSDIITSSADGNRPPSNPKEPDMTNEKILSSPLAVAYDRLVAIDKAWRAGKATKAEVEAAKSEVKRILKGLDA